MQKEKTGGEKVASCALNTPLCPPGPAEEQKGSVVKNRRIRQQGSAIIDG